MRTYTTIGAATMLAVALLLPAGVAAGDDDRDEELRRLREQIEELQRRLASLEQQAGETEDDELETLLQEARQAGGLGDDPEPVKGPGPGRSGQRNLSAMNPEISFLGDFSYGWTDGGLRDEFLLRGAELSFQAPLDPFTRFKAVLAGHQEPAELTFGEDGGMEPDEHGHDSDIGLSLEEVYMEWVALPLHSKVRLGKFRQQFGTLNRWHPHSLASTDSPMALHNVFGHEGLVGLGVGVDFQLPGLWASSNSLTFEITNADNSLAFAGAHFSDPSFLVRHTGFFDLGRWTYLELGLNGATGPNNEQGDRDTRLGGIDVNFLWEPEGKGQYRSLEFRGEYIRALFEQEDRSQVGSGSWYAYLTWQFDRNWYTGVRYDDVELMSDRIEIDPDVPFEPGLATRAFTGYLTWWQSEYVRLRLQVQKADRDVAMAAGPLDDTRAWLQVTFAAGPHKHESY